MTCGWAVETHTGSAADFHARDLPDPARRVVWCFRPSTAAVVLGSTEPEDHLDPTVLADLQAEVVRRRSGGAAVLLRPGEVVWVDLILPRGDPLWDDDVGRAAWWVGEVWSRALSGLGIAGTEVHRGPMIRTEWSDRICFAGRGPGEVSVQGRKVVGISQRRTRRAVRFQTALLVRWDVSTMAALCRLGPGGERALSRWATGAAELTPEGHLDAPTVEHALVAALPGDAVRG